MVKLLSQYVTVLDGHIRSEVVAGRIETAKAARDEKERAAILLTDMQARLPPASAAAGSERRRAPESIPARRPYRASLARGLVLWNRLGSDFEVTHSSVGPGGKRNAGRFVEGRFGEGIELNMDQELGVTFPPEIIPGPDGCIEFWAKLIDFPDILHAGDKPGLIAVCSDTGRRGFMLHFNANDGITGVDNGARKMAAFVDGQLNSRVWMGPTGDTLKVPTNGKFGLLARYAGMPPCSVVFDNLKIWNHAKTDFADRDSEAPK